MNETQIPTDQLPPENTTKRRILKSVQKEQQILQAALDCFAQTGLAKTSLVDIARVAKMGSSAILYHFKSTDDIFVSLSEQMFAQAQSLSKASSKKYSSNLDKTQAYAESMVAWLATTDSYRKLFLQFYSECLYNEQLRGLQKKIHRQGLDYLELLFHDKQKARTAQNLLTGSLFEFCLSPQDKDCIWESLREALQELHSKS